MLVLGDLAFDAGAADEPTTRRAIGELLPHSGHQRRIHQRLIATKDDIAGDDAEVAHATALGADDEFKSLIAIEITGDQRRAVGEVRSSIFACRRAVRNGS